MTKTVHFKTNTLLKNLVGRDLINDDNIAIVELVKNSYDAGSDSVVVRFDAFSLSQGTDSSSRIVIFDHGSGMTLSDIEDKWLNIAYSEKKFALQQQGSFLAGNKGIGRFSCDRLGRQLDLLTRVRRGEIYHLPIHWVNFEREGQKDLIIQEIDLEASTITNTQAAELAGLDTFPTSGTVLVISDLRSIWDIQRLRELKHALERFQNPNQLFQRQRFMVTLSVPDLEPSEIGKPYAEKITGEIQNQIFESLKFKSTYIESEIVEEKDNAVIRTELFHEGEKVFRIVEIDASLKLLVGIRVVIYYLNPYKKAYFKRQTGVRSVDFGSIFLFLNGFRVAPYGDRGDDWLGLDSRKGQGLKRYISTRDLVGRIEIAHDGDEFVPISSREGLKNTRAFVELKEIFALSVVKRLERFVVDGLGWDSIPQQLRSEVASEEGLDWERTNENYSESWQRKQQRIALNIITLIGSSRQRTDSLWFNTSLLEAIAEQRIEETKQLIKEFEGFAPDKVDDDLRAGLLRVRAFIETKEAEAERAKQEAAELRIEVEEHQQTITDLVEEKETYKAQSLFLQSVYSLEAKDLAKFHHQIRLDSDILANYISKALKALRSSNIKAAMESLEKASLANQRINSVAGFAVKANFKATTKKEPTDLPSFIAQYVEFVAKDLLASNLKIHVDNTVNESFEVRVARIEISILVDNIISNAKKAKASSLSIIISKIEENTIRISFIDDGNGLSPGIKNIEDIFSMGFTTTEGSGLGLYHVKNIIGNLGGVITAHTLSPKGLEIRIEVTR